mgnify:CR=1 FL=1
MLTKYIRFVHNLFKIRWYHVLVRKNKNKRKEGIKLFVVMIEQPIAGSNDTMDAEYSGIWHETRSEAEKELKKARLDPEIWASWIEER